MKNILIIAGEVSGDVQGARLIKALKEHIPEYHFWGLGGSQLSAEGVVLLEDITQKALVGFVEVAKQYRYIRGIFYSILNQVVLRNPDLVILIDYPGFNIRLAEKLKRKGIPVVYFISPQVWAWGKKRIKKIKKIVDLMLVIFPFEEPLYRNEGVNVKYVGHPLIDVIDKEIVDHDKEEKKWLHVLPHGKLVGLFPGSRIDEVKRHIPIMLDAAVQIKKHNPHTHFIVGCASDMICKYVKTINHPLEFDIGHRITYEMLHVCDLVLTSSGTATLEAACFGVPMVVVYKMHWLNYVIIRLLVNVPYIAMANIIAGKKIVPELIQHKATSNAIAQEADSILNDKEKYNAMRSELLRVRKLLGEKEVCQRAAGHIVELIKKSEQMK